MNMRLRAVFFVFGLGIALMLGASVASARDDKGPNSRAPVGRRLDYPATRVLSTRDVLFGVAVEDPYRWLEDEKSPEVQKWTAAQDRLARQQLANLPGRNELAKRFRELYYIDAVSPPVHRGNRYFYLRRHADREKGIYYWREGENGQERVLLDPNRMSADGSISLGVVSATLDGKTAAYTLRQNNSDEATLYVMDAATGKVSERDVIEGAKYAMPSWTPAGDGFYYTFLPTDPAIPPDKRPGYAEVRFHKLGTDPKSDPIIHEKTSDPTRFLSANLSRDGRWLFVEISHGWNSTDVYYRDLKSNDPKWKPFVVGRDAQYSVSVWRDHFYIETNDGAPRGKALRTPLTQPGREHWKEIVTEPTNAGIQSVQIIGEHLVITYLRNAANFVEVRTLDGELVREMDLPGIGSVAGIVGNPDEDDAYFGYTSFTIPSEIYRTSMKTGETKLWNRVKLPVDPSPYVAEQVWYPSRDGTLISMFLVHRKDILVDGSTPFLLTGYGGFDVGMTPTFAADAYPFLEAGGGYAIVNLRGGNEYGEEWHRAGMLDKKQNVFDDFIGAAQFLIQRKYTQPQRLAISGASNGGLLVGAALTQRPELFRAVVCDVPLLDMVRYHHFGSGRTWIAEYGSSEDERQFKTLLAYSPYHHVQQQTKYPAVLFMSADSDDRVDPMHARKMAARLQAVTDGSRPILLRIEKKAGHGGADLVKQSVEASADSMAFLMRQIGMKPARTQK
jgi:prolyl oligopeptidase